MEFARKRATLLFVVVDHLKRKTAEFTLSLLENQEQMLEEILAALDRMDKGAFGKCEECGAAIPKGRLQALPYTRHCLSCARRLQ